MDIKFTKNPLRKSLGRDNTKKKKLTLHTNNNFS